MFVDVAFYAAVTPLLPHYEDEFGLSKTGAGILAGSYAAGTLAMSLPSGWLASRLGTKRTAITGLVLMTVTSFAFAFANSIVLLDVARFVQGIGGACSWAGAMAWLAEAAPRERRGEMIGAATGAAIAGALFGPVLGAAANAASPEVVFSFVGVLGMGLVTWAAATPPEHADPPPPLAKVWQAFRTRHILGATWLVALPSGLFGAMAVLSSLRMDDLGASGLAIGAMFLVAAAVESALTPFYGKLSDRHGRKPPVIFGLAGMVLFSIALPLPGDALLLAAVVVVGVSVGAAFWGPAMALLSDNAERAGIGQGYAFAMVNLAWAGGQVAGAGLGAALADATADAVPYGIAGLLCALTLVAVTRGGVTSRAAGTGSP